MNWETGTVKSASNFLGTELGSSKLGSHGPVACHTGNQEALGKRKNIYCQHVYIYMVHIYIYIYIISYIYTHINQSIYIHIYCQPQVRFSFCQAAAGFEDRGRAPPPGQSGPLRNRTRGEPGDSFFFFFFPWPPLKVAGGQKFNHQAEVLLGWIFRL